MSSSPVVEPSSPASTPSSPALRVDTAQFHTSTPNFIGARKPPQPLNVVLPATAPATPPTYCEAVTPPRSPPAPTTPASGDARSHPPDGTSSDKSSETAVGTVSRATTALSRKESYKAQRQHYRREKKRAASALLHSIEDPSVIVLADWLKVRGSLKSWTKLWCVLKPGLLLLYKTPKAKSSHWVGTVLLTSCQVIERPSKKDGFCFKLYHPLEQSIWAPRGPHNETIGAVVQPLPTAHLIFRAPSQAAGHCWLDGLELALRCSNAMLRCSRSRPEQTIAAEAPTTQTNISHEELEKHFNEHDPSYCSSPLMSISDYPYTEQTNKNQKTRKTSKWAQFVESIEMMSKNDSSDSDSEKKEGFLDFLLKRDIFERNTASTSSVKEVEPKTKKVITSKSLASSPLRIELGKRSPILRCFDLPKLPVGDRIKEKVLPSSSIEENLLKFMATFPKRRSSTPSTKILPQKRISELRESGAKTDSENDEVFLKAKLPKKRRIEKSEVICNTPENIVITKTAPSLERFRKHYSSSSTDDVCDAYSKSPAYRHLPAPLKYSLIDYGKLPSASFAASASERRDERLTSQNVYVAGKIVRGELAGAASDTDSEASRGAMTPLHAPQRDVLLATIKETYVEDPDRDVGAAGELVEEVGEENKSLLWFLLKQVRPGMDLSKVVLPTFILEPRSFLDKLADSYYHADILALTKDLEDPYQRFKCVLRWYLSGLYRKPKGLKKPYNPVLGETFRCCWKHAPDNYTYYVAEQVSHHPPVSAFYVSNRKEGYVVEGSLLARSKFYGNSTSAILEGCVRVHLLHWNETYVTTAPYAHCKGIVIGTLSMELGGKVHIMCQETGYQADIEFKLRSFLSSADQTNAISGRIKKGKETIATVDGYWDGRIDIKDKKSGEESNLLDVSILKEQRLPRYLMRLEKQVEFESQRLWEKVSIAIHGDDQVAATEQKTIIEEGQRQRAKNLSSPWVPKLFRKDALVAPPEGLIDQGWSYLHLNTTPWQPDEDIEYEEDFVIKSLHKSAGGARALPPVRTRRASDSDTHDDVPRAKSASKGHVEVPRAPDSDSRGDTPPRAKSPQREPSALKLEHVDKQRAEDGGRLSLTTTRTLKQTLHSIDATLREQTQAIERLNRNVQAISDNQRIAYRPQNLGRAPPAQHSWDLFAGFVLAVVLQALLNWLFYQRD